MDEFWTCGVCEMKTFGDWNCEVRPREESDSEFKPVCKSCEVQVRETFVADEAL